MSHAKAQRRNVKEKKQLGETMAGSQAPAWEPLVFQSPACSLTIPWGSWSFKDRIPKLELGNEGRRMG